MLSYNRCVEPITYFRDLDLVAGVYTSPETNKYSAIFIPRVHLFQGNEELERSLPFWEIYNSANKDDAKLCSRNIQNIVSAYMKGGTFGSRIKVIKIVNNNLHLDPAFNHLYKAQKFLPQARITHEEAKELADTVSRDYELGSPKFKQTFVGRLCAVFNPAAELVRKLTGNFEIAAYQNSTKTLSYSEARPDFFVMLHELAHIVESRKEPRFKYTPPHSPEFVKIFGELLRKYTPVHLQDAANIFEIQCHIYDADGKVLRNGNKEMTVIKMEDLCSPVKSVSDLIKAYT